MVVSLASQLLIRVPFDSPIAGLAVLGEYIGFPGSFFDTCPCERLLFVQRHTC